MTTTSLAVSAVILHTQSNRTAPRKSNNRNEQKHRTKKRIHQIEIQRIRVRRDRVCVRVEHSKFLCTDARANTTAVSFPNRKLSAHGYSHSRE